MTTSTSTTTTQLEDFKESRASISSSTTTLCTLVDPSFHPTQTLTVDARGIGAFRLPIPSRQTEIAIHHADGSEAYVSTRDKLWSGNSILSHPKQGNLIRTEYFFGPNRDPILRLLHTSSVIPEEIKVTGQWTSRTTRFMMPNGQEYEWAYAKEKADGNRINLLILRAVKNPRGKEEIEYRRIAQLVRSSETRTSGTSRCTAGNGGELQIQEGELDSAVIVATCLMMLKKEIDRRRLIQFAIIGGAAGSS